MKYLMPFNEKNSLYNSIKYDTNNYLSYLIDNDYKVTFSDDIRYHMVYISKKDRDFIIWSDIKDDVVPYLQMMSKNYYLEYIESRDTIIGQSLLKSYYFKLDLESLIREKNIKFTTLSLAFKKTAKKDRKVNEKLDNTLYVFDLDDTLVETPSFEELSIEFLKENVNIKDILNSCVSDIGVHLSDLKWENGRLFIDDFESNINIPNGINWVRKGKRIYLLTPDNFGLTKISLPTSILPEMVEIYNSVENKCIVTARSEKIREDIEKILTKFGINYPKFGLHMYPNNKHYKAGAWKGKKIIEIAEENGFSDVIFYDDNAKYIKDAKKVIDSTNLKFKAIKV